MKQPMRNRILSFVLALVLLACDVPLPVLSVTKGDTASQSSTAPKPELKYDYETMKITRDGKTVSELEILHTEKIELSADCVPEDATYQWQVEHPEKDGVWVNVYDGTEKTIGVSVALVENVLRQDGTARLRCRAYTETYAYLSNAVTVKLVAQEAPQAESAPKDGIVPMADSDPEFVSITIRYQQYDYVKVDGVSTLVCTDEDVFTSYIATLTYKASYTGKEVVTPTLVGYTKSMEKVTLGGEAYTGGAVSYNDGTVFINFDQVTADVVIYVKYVPDKVQYQVRYFFQNVYDDLYVEDPSLLAPDLDAQGYTGTTPDFQADKVPGFTCLWYEPENIAADGSTVFYIYYERNYYLMEFDCDGGYGTDTLYVRYGTYVNVPNPVKSGFVFAKWDLVSTDNPGNSEPLGTLVDDRGDSNPLNDIYSGDGYYNELPANLPHYNTAYKALWTEADTTYKVAYWIVNGEEKTYLGSYIESAVSGHPVFGSDTLGSSVICGGSNEDHTHTKDCLKCGLDHAHTDDCWGCGIKAHNHSDECCENPNHYHTHTGACYGSLTSNNAEAADINAIKSISDGTNPESGYVYVITTGNGRYWPKLYLNNQYYLIDGIQGGDQNSYASIVGDEIARSTYNGYTAIKYEAKVKCNLHGDKSECVCDEKVHTHTETCYICDKHEHTDDCRMEDKHLIYLKDKTEEDDDGKVAEGDGSTVVNVYYQYKTYTLRFYYAKKITTENVTDGTTSEKFYVVGGSTYPFGGYGVSKPEKATVTELLRSVGQWGEVQDLPELKDQYLTGGDKERPYRLGTLPDGNTTYYYLEFTEKYGASLEYLWPVDIFKPVLIEGTHIQCPGLEYAYFSAWNGEYRVKYTQDCYGGQHGGNQTIKGLYMYLDEDVIFDGQFEDVYYKTPDGEETSLVSYLGFWDNGYSDGTANFWSVPKQYTYHIMVESTDVTDVLGKTYRTFGEKKYELLKEFIVYDNSNLNQLSNQTPIALKGYTHVGTDFDNEDYVYNYSLDEPDLQSVDYYFYYDVNIHTITFWNHSEHLSSGVGASVAHGTKLDKYGVYANNMVYSEDNPTGKYPSSLEPGAYYFDGWYTTEHFDPDTKMDWSQTMPDSDFVVYAKWVPVIRNIYFYLTYDDQDLDGNGPDTPVYWDEDNKDYPIQAEHGDILGSKYNYFPTRTQMVNGETIEYTFVGWFYMDENNKKRFAPDTMEIKKDLHLFAEWRTEVDTGYTVNYVLKEDKTPIADPTTGHMSAGHTKTFEAKGNDLFFDAYAEKALFPTTSSHSILMDPDPNNNIFTFEYVEDDKVLYQIQYVDKVKGTVLDQTGVLESDHAVITVKHKPIAGYVPQDYYITRVLTADGKETAPIAENIIVFYYIPATTTALYTVEFFQEKLDSTDPSKPENYESVQTTVFSGDIDANIPYSVNANQFTGFSYAFSTVTTYKKDGDAYVVDATKTDTDTSLSGKLTAGGLEFKVYYSRNSVGYTIKLLEWGTNELLGNGTLGENQYKVGSEQTYTAADSVKKGGVDYFFYPTTEKPQTQTMIIQANKEANVLIFYYKTKEVNIYYHEVCLTPGAKDQEFGHVSRNVEYLTSAEVEGATAMPSSGFRFVGWYSDAECTDTDKVSSAALWVPPRPNEDVHYYALFEPITTELTISKDVKELPSGMSNDDSFLFRVQGTGKTGYIDLVISVQGSGSVTLAQLPVGVYTVTELNGWSWEYTCDGYAGMASGDTNEATITVDTTTGTITFTNTYADPDWLGGEDTVDNKFAGVHTP